MGKLIRAVLRGRNGGNTVLLPDQYEQDGVNAILIEALPHIK